MKPVRWLLAIVALAVGLVMLYWTPDTDAVAMRAKYGAPPSMYVDLGDGLRVHVRDEGSRGAPVLVLLHGSNSDLHTWDAWTQRLVSTHRVVRFDQIGHGLTGSSPTRDYSTAAFVSTVDRLTTKLGIAKFALAGSSMGGGIAWQYAVAHPDRLTGLILVDASGAPDLTKQELPLAFRLARTPGARELMLNITPRSIIADGVRQSFGDARLVTDAMIDRYWELLRYPGNRQATLDRFTTPRAVTDPVRLAALQVPTLILWGERDRLLPASGARWFGERISGARVVVYPGVGHLPMEEVADRSSVDILDFLTSRAGASR